jgi:hypothetical protein
MKIELLWFEDCPNHEPAEQMLAEVLAEFNVGDPIARVEVPDVQTGNEVTFPGSPTIRIDGVDIEPNWEPCEDCTPRCRIYFTPSGLRGLPERDWIVEAVQRAITT